MAAWAAPKGVWATQVEEGDGDAPPAPPPEAFPSLGGAKADALFPTLDAVKNTKTSKKKQKQTMSLTEFNLGPVGGGGGGRSAGGGGGGAYKPPGGGGGGGGGYRTDDIELPKGPRQREEGEEEARPGQLGGAFRDYGGDRGGGGDRGAYSDDPPPAFRCSFEASSRASAPAAGGRDGGRDGDRDGGRRGYGGFEDREERRPPRGEEDGPSRAETGDWGKRTGFVPSTGRDGPRMRDDRDGDGDDRGRGEDLGPSRADEVCYCNRCAMR